MSFFAELKRRNVFKVGIAYLITSWLVIQVADILLENIGAPSWVLQTIFVVVGVGFFVATFVAWAFELTPEGVKLERDVDRSKSVTKVTGQKLNNAIIGVLVLALGYFAIDKFVLDPDTTTKSASSITAESKPVPSTGSQQTPMAATLPVPEVVQKSIVVLPFVNMSNDPDQEFFSDGLSEELLNVLAQVEDLRVISRTSAFAFKGKDVDIPTIAAQLNVTHVLEGSVRKAGDDVRITAQLIEVSTDSHLWSDAYNRKLDNVFEIQEEISQAITRELKVKLGTGARTGRPTENLEAYQLFLRGRHLYQNRGEAQLVRSIELLKLAVELDPKFADAWANLAAANFVHGYSQKNDQEAFTRNALQAAKRAIEVDPENGFAHAVLAVSHVSNFNWEDAMREYDIAIQLNPNETNSVMWKGIALCNLGYIDQAIEIFQQAEQLDPVFTVLQMWMGLAYMAKGDIEQIYQKELKIQQLDPDFRESLQEIYEVLSGNLEAAEKIGRAADMKNLSSDVLAVAMYSAMRDPTLREQSVKVLLDNKSLAPTGSVENYLWRIGAVEESLAEFHDMIQRGRGLNAVNSLTNLWDAYTRDNLAHPAMPAFFEEMGMADYWRNHGDPDYCRVDGAKIECDGQ